MKRKMSLLMAFMMAATLVPAIPANAASVNTIDRVVSATTDDNTVTTYPSLTLGTDSVKLGAKDGESFELHLQGGAEWSKKMNGTYSYTDNSGMKHDLFTAEVKTDTVVEINVIKGGSITIPLKTDFSNAVEGKQEVVVVPKDSSVSAGTYTFATVGEKQIQIKSAKKYKISRSGSNEVTFSLNEITRAAFGSDGEKVTLRLPKGFSWESFKTLKKDNNGNFIFESANDPKKIDGATVVTSNDGRDVVVSIPAGDNGKLESVYVTAKINADRTAALGDVDITVKQGAVSPSSLVIAEYVQDTVTVKANKVLDVIAGKDVEGMYKAKVTIEENVGNALLQGRYVEMSLDNASLQDGENLILKRTAGQGVLKIDETSQDALTKTKDGDARQEAEVSTIRRGGNLRAGEWDLHVTKATGTDKAGKYELEIPFVVKAGFTGDLVLNVKGAGISGDAKNGGVDVKIATVKAPVTVEVKQPLPQVKIGLQKQAGSNIIVKETEAGALQDYMPSGASSSTEKFVTATRKSGVYGRVNGEIVYIGHYTEKQKDAITEFYNRRIYVTRGNTKAKKSDFAEYLLKTTKKEFGLSFESADIKVTDGNMLLNDDESDRVAQVKGGFKNAIKIAVDRKSTKASTIEVSNVTATLDRTVPYGNVKLDADFGVVETRHDLDNTVTTVDYFTTVTPVDETKRITTVFTIDQKGYSEVNGMTREDKNAEVAPFISKEGRTMLPLRYVANAIGAAINYDSKTRVATFTKNQTVVSLNIDKKEMNVNGSTVPLFSKPANVEGRVFLPLVNVASAFGLDQGKNIIWNQDAKTVTILPQDATVDEIKKAQEGKTLEGTVTSEQVKADEKKADEKKADDTKKEETKTTTTK